MEFMFSLDEEIFQPHLRHEHAVVEHPRHLAFKLKQHVSHETMQKMVHCLIRDEKRIKS